MSKLIKGGADHDTGQFRFSQDLAPYTDYAAASRIQAKSLFQNQKTNYRSFAIIPDIIAVDIMKKFGVDVHAKDNGQDELSKIRKIVINNYPQLLTGNIVKHPQGR